MSDSIIYNPKIAQRFRGYLPVVIDVECGGLNPTTDALLEIAAVTINCDDNGIFYPAETFQHHIEPFAGGILNPESLAINRIDPHHPFRFAVTEETALNEIFVKLQKIQKQAACNRCVLVGHNAWFDLAFLNAAISRSKAKRNPFHAFTSFDTATLGALAYGHTVLAEALKRADIPFDNNDHHSAIYDAEQTAKLFCKIINQWSWPL
jgi:ribonuclease T